MFWWGVLAGAGGALLVCGVGAAVWLWRLLYGSNS